MEYSLPPCPIFHDQHQGCIVTTPKSNNLTPVEHRVDMAARGARNKHRGGVLWFTGLPGAGKSTLAIEVERHLFEMGYQVYALDGDNIRRSLSADLGFSQADRAENVRRVGELAALLADAGLIAIAAMISPYHADRARARAAARTTGFHEVYIKADLVVCERRDPKGLYKRAHAGEIPDFTGVSAPYEDPARPDLTIDTTASVDDCATGIVDYVVRNFAITA